MDRRCLYVADTLWAPVITSRNHRGTPSTRPTQRHTPSTPPSQRSIAHPRSRGRPRTRPSHATTLSLPHARTRSSLFSKQIISHSLSLSAATLTPRRTPPKSLKTLLCTLSNFGYVCGTLFRKCQSISRQFDLDSLGRHLSTAGLLLFVVVRGAVQQQTQQQQMRITVHASQRSDRY